MITFLTANEGEKGGGGEKTFRIVTFGAASVALLGNGIYGVVVLFARRERAINKGNDGGKGEYEILGSGSF